MARDKRVVFGPVLDWSKKVRATVEERDGQAVKRWRQFVLYEAAGWEAKEKFEELGGRQAMLEAAERTSRRIADNGVVDEADILGFHTMVERESQEFELEEIKINSEEAAVRALYILREGLLSQEVMDCNEVISTVESLIEVQEDGTEVEFENVKVMTENKTMEFLLRTPRKPKARREALNILDTIPDSQSEQDEDIRLEDVGSGASTPTPQSGRKREGEGHKPKRDDTPVVEEVDRREEEDDEMGEDEDGDGELEDEEDEKDEDDEEEGELTREGVVSPDMGLTTEEGVELILKNWETVQSVIALGEDDGFDGKGWRRALQDCLYEEDGEMRGAKLKLVEEAREAFEKCIQDEDRFRTAKLEREVGELRVGITKLLVQFNLTDHRTAKEAKRRIEAERKEKAEKKRLATESCNLKIAKQEQRRLEKEKEEVRVNAEKRQKIAAELMAEVVRTKAEAAERLQKLQGRMDMEEDEEFRMVLEEKKRQIEQTVEALEKKAVIESEVCLSGGFVLVESKVARSVEVTILHPTTVTEERKKRLGGMVEKVAAGLRDKLISMGRRPWKIEGRADSQVSNRETVWKLEAVPTDVTEIEARDWLTEQVMTVFGRDKVERVWITNKAAMPIIIRYLVGEGDSQNVVNGLEKENAGMKIKWGNYRPVKIGKYNDWKVEVESAKEAERLIRAQVFWKGKKVKVRTQQWQGKELLAQELGELHQRDLCNRWVSSNTRVEVKGKGSGGQQYSALGASGGVIRSLSVP
ncbi:hypothetical protein EV426DRAFT_578179 [Tirmania nivea]|nr:hypothetical protein EV426DRAFT_578179 [Tirmania nivea]